MKSAIEASHRVANDTLQLLKKAGLPATGANYELFFRVAEGRNPSLAREIDKARDAFGRLPQAAADELYRLHIRQADLSTSVIDLVSRFRAEVTDLHGLIEASGDAASGDSDTLCSLSAELRASTADYPSVGKLLEEMVTLAHDMRSRNETLEARLADSADEINALQESIEIIQAEAMKDALTGIANRAHFDKAFEREVAAAAMSGEPLALVLADIDHFKKFNDTYGHQTGDQVLRLVAEVMNANVKGRDVLARYGGEEFAIILPQTSLANAEMLADRIRAAVEGRRLKKRSSSEDLGVITMSMGVAAARAPDTPETVIERADQCLYAAKENGRNRVVTEAALSKGAAA